MSTGKTLFLAALFASTGIGLILTFVLLIKWLSHPLKPHSFSVELGPDWLAFDGKNKSRVAARFVRARIPRKALKRARAKTGTHGRHSLIIEAWKRRYVTGWGSLRPGELEWLAEVINTWKEQG